MTNVMTAVAAAVVVMVMMMMTVMMMVMVMILQLAGLRLMPLVAVAHWKGQMQHMQRI
jgi:hypothetical protein